MKTPEEIHSKVIKHYMIGSLHNTHNEAVEIGISLIRQAQKEAYNQALSDAINKSYYDEDFRCRIITEVEIKKLIK